MSKNITFNRLDALKIVLAILTFGIGWVANNQATVISFSAMIIVWLVAIAMRKYDYKPTKGNLTVIVFAVAIGLTLLFQPVLFPLFPEWTGDAATFSPVLITYMAELLRIAAGVVAYATGVYNILLSQVLEKVAGVASVAIKGVLSLL
jgi:hypothetical protein